MTIETHTARFSIEGEFLTETARHLMLSENPSGAWRLITRGIDGDGVADAVQGILDGCKKLTGTNDLELVDEDPANVESYLRSLRYIFGGRIRINGTWWRPVATINPGPESARFASEGSFCDLSGSAAMRAWSQRRAAFYCGPCERAVFDETDRRYVVWETCGEPPHWWDPHPSHRAALTHALEGGRRLDERGEDVRDREVLDAMKSRVEPDEYAEARRVLQEAAEEERSIKLAALIEDIREKVRAQAGDDTFELVVPADDRTQDRHGLEREPTAERRITVPRAPFWRWALGRTALRHMAPPWEEVSPSGLKLQLDDPCHTDWMLGAGLDLSEDYAYNSPVSIAASEEAHRIQEEVGNFEVAVLVDSGYVHGEVGKEILVLPNLSVKYAVDAMQPGVRAIIAEVGGALAHLSTVGREQGWTIMRVSDAVSRYPKGTRLALDPGRGLIVLTPEP